MIQYTLSCPDQECQSETLNGDEDSARLRVFTMNEVNVTLTAMHRCNTTIYNSTTVTGVIVPQVETPSLAAASTGIYSIAFTYFLSKEGVELFRVLCDFFNQLIEPLKLLIT